ncbi:MAG: V-type ATP synthase subunit D [Hyphomicrobiales bacterium]
MADRAPTRSAALALAEERTVIRQGYDFLDEKRMLLAGEMVSKVARHRELEADWQHRAADAAEALGGAVAALGLDGLQSWPPLLRDTARIERTETAFLGVFLVAAKLDAAHLDPEALPLAFAPLAASPAAETARAAFAGLIGLAAEMAAVAASLHRLMEDYRRTERRARALENVLLPDIEAELKRIGEHLEMVDQEEAVRVRKAAARQAR